MTVAISPGYNALGVWLYASGAPQTWISGSGLRGRTIYGTSENDYIYGGGGGCTMVGGAGDDTYFLWELADRILEGQDGGADTLVSYGMAYRLPLFVENMSVENDGSTGTGNALDNIIAGGDGGQMLDGGTGNDILTGGAGIDLFLVRRGMGRDVVTDFLPGTDKIVVHGDLVGFTSLAALRAALRQEGTDAVLEFGSGDSTVLRSVDVASLSAADFRLPASSIDGLRLTFGDEFSSFSGTPTGFAADGSATWRSTFIWGGRTLPNEVEYYADATTVGPNPFALRDAAGQGVLDITARPTSGLPDGLTYTSGLIISSSSLVQTYGYFEMRAQIPSGAGFWPAFWLGRADLTWPPEIDVMEILGDAPGRVHTTVHSLETGTHTQASSAYWEWEDLSLGFHTYSVSWRPDFITFYLDGTELYRTATPADMHSPMYMLANLAVGGVGSWPGPTDGVSSATLSIDYIRAWQFADLAAPMHPIDVRASMIAGNGAGQRLTGTVGDDRITGERGNDTLTGGTGADTFVFTAGDGKDAITDFTPGVDHLLLVGQSASSVTAKLGSTGLVVSYNKGKDAITLHGVKALAPGDLSYGDSPLPGTTGGDLLDRSAATRAQNIQGSTGNDTVAGGSGDDWLGGGQGNDLLRGGGGHDTFVFEMWDGHDAILDFASGVDRILLRGIPAASVWVNPARDTAGIAGLEIDYGGSGDSIFVRGLASLTAGDIVFDAGR